MGLLDGVTGNISEIVSQTLTPDMVDALSSAMGNLASQLTDASGAPANVIADELSHMAGDLQVNLDPNAGAEHAVDATAEAAAVVLPASVDPNEYADRLDDLHGALQGVVADAAGRLSNPDPEVRASAQLDLEQAQQLMEVLQSTLTQLHDGDVQVIDNLHSNADGVHDDGTVVAVADTADAHAGSHADTDSGTSHAADHVDAAPAHDDAAASDPSATSV